MFKLKIYFTTITGRRETNEDKHNIILNINDNDKNINNINFFGIYDGHGGNYVSNYLEKNLPNYYLDKKIKHPFNKVYHDEVFKIIQNKLLETEHGYSAGSTCLVSLMYKYKNEIHLNVINLGDSRMTIIYSNGSFKKITRDHKPDDKIEKKRLQQMGGEIYKDSEGVFRIGNLSLSRAFGDGDNIPYISQKPDVFYKKITNDTKYIIMACDGLWDVIESNEIGEILNSLSESKSKNLASDLAKIALEKGSGDNISIIVIEVIS